jgi:hypothetical protein
MSLLCRRRDFDGAFFFGVIKIQCATSGMFIAYQLYVNFVSVLSYLACHLIEKRFFHLKFTRLFLRQAYEDKCLYEILIDSNNLGSIQCKPHSINRAIKVSLCLKAI